MNLHVNNNCVYLHCYPSNNINLHTFKLMIWMIFESKCAKLTNFARKDMSALIGLILQNEVYIILCFVFLYNGLQHCLQIIHSTLQLVNL